MYFVIKWRSFWEFFIGVIVPGFVARFRPLRPANHNERLNGFPPNSKYKMRRGLAVIFNHHTFADANIKVRTGSQIDRVRLTEILNSFGFDVETCNDFTKAEIMAKAREGLI